MIITVLGWAALALTALYFFGAAVLGAIKFSRWLGPPFPRILETVGAGIAAALVLGFGYGLVYVMGVIAGVVP